MELIKLFSQDQGNFAEMQVRSYLILQVRLEIRIPVSKRFKCYLSTYKTQLTSIMNTAIIQRGKIQSLKYLHEHSNGKYLQ